MQRSKPLTTRVVAIPNPRSELQEALRAVLPDVGSSCARIIDATEVHDVGVNVDAERGAQT